MRTISRSSSSSEQYRAVVEQQLQQEKETKRVDEIDTSKKSKIVA